ncbi:MAG: GNAT family N-acetyltransferase [Chloroflexota bacterium]|nr:GNAT family N-acetyltransferase [Chloroflexota bacterium]
MSRRAVEPLSDLALLELREEMAMDDRRRLAGLCGVTIAVTLDGQSLFMGSEVPDAILPAVIDAVNDAPVAPWPDEEPAALAACRGLLESSCAPLNLSAGPVYSIQPRARIETRTRIVRSDELPVGRPRLVNPGTWEHDEWDDLLDGTLGPWAMVVVDGSVASIAHTPGPMSERVAEVGAWTHPDHRGRGYAAEATTNWADVLRPSGRYLFYSTDAANLSSQRVAGRLELRLLGWTWTLQKVDPSGRDTRHPLSRRRP